MMWLHFYMPRECQTNSVQAMKQQIMCIMHWKNSTTISCKHITQQYKTNRFSQIAETSNIIQRQSNPRLMQPNLPHYVVEEMHDRYPTIRITAQQLCKHRSFKEWPEQMTTQSHLLDFLLINSLTKSLQLTETFQSVNSLASPAMGHWRTYTMHVPQFQLGNFYWHLSSAQWYRLVVKTTHFPHAVVYLVTSLFQFIIFMQKFMWFLPDFVNTHCDARHAPPIFYYWLL